MDICPSSRLSQAIPAVKLKTLVSHLFASLYMTTLLRYQETLLMTQHTEKSALDVQATLRLFKSPTKPVQSVMASLSNSFTEHTIPLPSTDKVLIGVAVSI